MKKLDKFLTQAQKRSWETEPATHGGEVVKVTKDSYWVLWDGSNAPIEIKKDRFELVGKRGEKEIHKIRKETHAI